MVQGSQLPPEDRAGVSASRTPKPEIHHILDEDWSEEYAISPEWGMAWRAIQEDQQEWPAGYRMYAGKLYLGEKLCIPEELVHLVLKDFHYQKGHIGVERMLSAIPDSFAMASLDPKTTLKKLVMEIKRCCPHCQASEPPNWAVRGQYEATPIPEHPFVSVCVDIFSMPEVVWKGASYDQMVLCVDRHSGWMIARPTEKLGLTAEKCAHLLIEGGMGILGVPSVITSDQGPQFAGKWFRTMCARLGVRQAFSQAHRPQANGKAESAGKQVITLMRKMHAEEGMNWVEALPRVLMRLHDMAGEGGLSPHQIIMGRPRSLGALPYNPERDCPDAEEFLDHVAEMDASIAEKLEKNTSPRTEQS